MLALLDCEVGHMNYSSSDCFESLWDYSLLLPYFEKYNNPLVNLTICYMVILYIDDEKYAGLSCFN